MVLNFLTAKKNSARWLALIKHGLKKLSIGKTFDFRMSSVVLIVFSLSACGGGSDSSPSTPTPSPVPVETASPIPEPTTPPIVVCDSADYLSMGESGNSIESLPPADECLPVNVQIPVQSVSASSFQDPNVPENTIDNDTSDGSRWSAQGIGEWLQLDLGSSQVFNTLEIFFLKNNERNTCFNIQVSNDGQTWTTQRSNIVSNGQRLFAFSTATARYIRYDGLGNSESTWNSIIEIDVYRNAFDPDMDISDGNNTSVCSGTISEGSEVSVGAQTSGTGAIFVQGNPDPNNTPNQNFDLSYWKITYPEADGDVDPPEVRPDSFFTDSVTGAMVFRCINRGGQTSSSTKYSRSELREMLSIDRSAGTKSLGNNWVISTAPLSDQEDAGGIDGNMKATVAVNHVSTSTTAGDEYMLGRVIVGQIHASEDEPFKIYYRKLPNNTYGSVYFSYEDSKTELYFEMIGLRDGTASGPEDGIALDEKWAYEVDVQGRDMTVTVIRENGNYVQQTITWDSEYDDDWFYFKAGNYNQNNGGDIGDYAQVSFFHLEASHDQFVPAIP